MDRMEEGCEFFVKDTGIGIKEEAMNVLFREFGRTSDTFLLEGTGLGLVLSKKLVELHNGRIEVKSKYKEGSEFIVYIPLKS